MPQTRPNLIAITLVLSASGTGCLALSSQIKQEPPVYVLTSNLATRHPEIVLSHEYAALWKDFKRADNWRDKLTYLLLAPAGVTMVRLSVLRQL